MSAKKIMFDIFRALKGRLMKDPGNAGSIQVDRFPAVIPIDSSTATTRTVRVPTRAGLQLLIYGRTITGTATLTFTSGYNDAGDTTFAISAAGQFLKLESIETASGTFRWRKVADQATGNVAPFALGTSAASSVLSVDANQELNDIGVIRSVDVIIATAAVLTLNTTPVDLVAAPGAGVYIEFVGAYVFLDYAGTAYAADAGEDLCIRYTDGSGDIVSTDIDGEEFEVTADALYILTPVPTAPNVITHADNAKLVAHVKTGNWATGTSPLKIRVFYRLVRKASLEAIA